MKIVQATAWIVLASGISFGVHKLAGADFLTTLTAIVVFDVARSLMEGLATGFVKGMKKASEEK